MPLRLKGILLKLAPPSFGRGFLALTGADRGACAMRTMEATMRLVIVVAALYWAAVHYPDFRVGVDLLWYDLNHRGATNVRY